MLQHAVWEAARQRLCFHRATGRMERNARQRGCFYHQSHRCRTLLQRTAARQPTATGIGGFGGRTGGPPNSPGAQRQHFRGTGAGSYSPGRWGPSLRAPSCTRPFRPKRRPPCHLTATSRTAPPISTRPLAGSGFTLGCPERSGILQPPPSAFTIPAK